MKAGYTDIILILSLTSLGQTRTLRTQTSDTCGEDRTVLGDWFVLHGGVSLLLDPVPSLVSPVLEDPYLDPANPPPGPTPQAVCAMQWSDIEESDTGHRSHYKDTGHRKYHLRDFPSV